MKELVRTNDPVRLSWLQALLAGAGIDTIILDTHTSIIEGSIGAIPPRLMVSVDDHRRACAALADAGEAAGRPRPAPTPLAASACSCAARSGSGPPPRAIAPPPRP